MRQNRIWPLLMTLGFLGLSNSHHVPTLLLQALTVIFVTLTLSRELCRKERL